VGDVSLTKVNKTLLGTSFECLKDAFDERVKGYFQTNPETDKIKGLCACKIRCCFSYVFRGHHE